MIFEIVNVIKDFWTPLHTNKYNIIYKHSLKVQYVRILNVKDSFDIMTLQILLLAC